MTTRSGDSEHLEIFFSNWVTFVGILVARFFLVGQKSEFGLSLTVHLIGRWFGALRSQIGTVVYVRSHNFFICEAISMVLSVLERRDTVLSNAPKITEIGWETTKLWSQTYATVQNLMI